MAIMLTLIIISIWASFIKTNIMVKARSFIVMGAGSKAVSIKDISKGKGNMLVLKVSWLKGYGCMEGFKKIVSKLKGLWSSF